MDELLDCGEVARGDGAALITTPMGEMPGETFARLVAFDGLVHGWDLASSTGQRFELPADRDLRRSTSSPATH